MKYPRCHKNNHFPRPQMVTSEWMSLDGVWDFLFDDDNMGETKQYFLDFKKTDDILVPFSYQTKLSGIHDLKEHPYLWYRKKIQLPEKQDDQRWILHFEGSDYLSKVWVNGIFVGHHHGGYTRFSFDISPMVKDDRMAEIVVRVEDLKEAVQPRGKQTWIEQPFGCWYQETNGIWKSVWVEMVSDIHLKDIKITPSIYDYDVAFEVSLNRFRKDQLLKIEIFYDGTLINEVQIKLLRRITNIKLDMNNDLTGFRVHYWTPNHPELYDVVFTLYDQERMVQQLESYFGFRTIRTEKNVLLLNNNPLYLKMVLHQGYYRDSGLSAPNSEALFNDLKLVKQLGFNGVRMHQKIEDERFYFYADVLGLIVWCEMPSAYEFKDETITNYVNQWQRVVKQLYNHPSICSWVPLNESWGVPRIVFDSSNQHLAQTLYHVTKAYDPYRPVISNDGWEQPASDLVTLHNYTQDKEQLKRFYGDLAKTLAGKNIVDYTQTRLPFANGYQYQGQPVIISEFAGIGYKNGSDAGWGYGEMVSSKEQFLQRLSDLVKVIRNIDDICGFCITQLTDVENEINGLLDIDRKPKAPIELLIKAIKGE